MTTSQIPERLDTNSFSLLILGKALYDPVSCQNHQLRSNLANPTFIHSYLNQMKTKRMKKSVPFCKTRTSITIRNIDHIHVLFHEFKDKVQIVVLSDNFFELDDVRMPQLSQRLTRRNHHSPALIRQTSKHTFTSLRDMHSSHE